MSKRQNVALMLFAVVVFLALAYVAIFSGNVEEVGGMNMSGLTMEGDTGHRLLH